MSIISTIRESLNKDTNKSIFKQVFSVLCQFNQRFEEMNADRHVKKMTTLQLVELMASAQVNQEPALRDICYISIVTWSCLTRMRYRSRY